MINAREMRLTYQLLKGKVEVTDLNEYESTQLELIKKWRAEEPSVVSAAVGFVSQPLVWAFNKIVPAKAIEASLQGAEWLASKTLTGNKFTENSSLEEIDSEVKSVSNWALTIGIGEGAAAGAIGILSAPADIPALIVLSLRTIRQIGCCYGYTSQTEEEKQFVLGVLSCAGSNSVAEKSASLYLLAAIQKDIAKKTFKKMAESTVGREAAIIMIRDLAKQIGINLTKRKLLAAIPVIGAAVGAAMNGYYINDIATSAQRAYQERWLKDRGKILQNA